VGERAGEPELQGLPYRPLRLPAVRHLVVVLDTDVASAVCVDVFRGVLVTKEARGHAAGCC